MCEFTQVAILSGFQGVVWAQGLGCQWVKYDSLKEEQIECIRRVICLREDVLAVLPTGFGKNLIYQVSFLCMCIRVEDCVSGLKLNLQIVKCSRSWLSKYPLVRDKESNN